MATEVHKVTLFVGDVDESLSVSAKKYNSNAFLINHSNYKKFLNGNFFQDTTVYTSLGDLPKDLQIFVDLCILADEIYYCPPVVWSDHNTFDEFNPTASIQGLTENLLLLISAQTPVYGLTVTELQHPIPLVDKRKTDDPQLWIAGCSISHGVGVLPEHRYGVLLADHLGLECSFLTRAGSAIDWASDQIIRSDIRPNDIVIFGVTSSERLTYVNNKKLVSGVTITTYDALPDVEKFLPKYNLVTENTFYQHIISIERVINFCSKIRAKLLLVGLLTSPNMFRFLFNKHNFVQYPYNPINQTEFLDVGSDNKHPGQLQHQEYKNFILNNLNS